jgi:hypothetical protein
MVRPAWASLITSFTPVRTLYCFAEACGYEEGNELATAALALTFAHLEAHQLTADVGVHFHGDDHGP